MMSSAEPSEQPNPLPAMEVASKGPGNELTSPATLVASNETTKHDSGTLSEDWSQDLLQRYTSQLSALDGQEEVLLHRLAAVQKLQILWSTAGRQSEMDRSNKRIKMRTTKVLLEDERLSQKRRKLSGVMAAVQDLVGMLDGNEENVDDEAVS